MCRHNNQMNYCPSCAGEKSMRGMGRLNGMGADTCPTGYYRLKVYGIDTGQCLPTGSTAVEAAQSGVLNSAATGVANSAATKNALSSASATAIGTKIVNFYKTNPVIAIGVTVAVGALLVYGTMSFVRGK